MVIFFLKNKIYNIAMDMNTIIKTIKLHRNKIFMVFGVIGAGVIIYKWNETPNENSEYQIIKLDKNNKKSKNKTSKKISINPTLNALGEYIF